MAKSRSCIARRARGAERLRGVLEQYVEGASSEPAAEGSSQPRIRDSSRSTHELCGSIRGWFFQRTGLQKPTRQLGLSIFLLLFFCGTHVRAAEPTPEIAVFISAGVSHCEVARAFLLMKPRLAEVTVPSLQGRSAPCWTIHNDYSSPDLPQQETEGILQRTLGCCRSRKERNERNER